MYLKAKSFRARLLYLIGGVIAGFVILTVLLLFDSRSQMMNEKRIKVRNVTEVAYDVLQYHYALEKSGAMSREEAQNRAKNTLRALRYDKNEYFWVNDMQPKMIMHPIKPELDGTDLTNNHDPNGKLLFVEFTKVVKDGGAGFVDYYWSKPGADRPVPKLSYVKGFEPWAWIVGSGIYIDDVDTQFHHEALRIATIALITLSILIGMAILLSRSIFHQLGGEPAYAMQATKEIADGNLTLDLVDVGATNSVLGSLKGMQNQLAKIFRDIHTASQGLSEMAKKVAIAARESNQAGQNQAQATAAMAASVEEMTVSINEISELSLITENTSEQVASLSETGKDQVTKAEQQMGNVANNVHNASTKVEGLLRRSEEIGSITNVIKEIADQTNLLALNAAIEAARAGEQGRGFAVVADEVRKLAERTTNATTEISTLIQAVQGETQQAVDEMGQVIPLVNQGTQLTNAATTTLETIYRESRDSLTKVRNVAQATKEQAAAANEISRHVESVAQMAEEVSTIMAKTAQHAQDMEEIAQNLRAKVGYFRI